MTAAETSVDQKLQIGLLRLYLARSTPNSVRAEHNLAFILAELGDKITVPTVEIIDVFSRPKRAMTDGIVVTPTLIGANDGRRVVLMGDLEDRVNASRILQDLFRSGPR